VCILLVLITFTHTQKLVIRLSKRDRE